MLVCAGNKDNYNMMTASWGCLGWLWNKPVAVVFIRPERHTHQLIEENEMMTLSSSAIARKPEKFIISAVPRVVVILIRQKKLV